MYLNIARLIENVCFNFSFTQRQKNKKKHTAHNTTTRQRVNRGLVVCEPFVYSHYVTQQYVFRDGAKYEIVSTFLCWHFWSVVCSFIGFLGLALQRMKFCVFVIHFAFITHFIIFWTISFFRLRSNRHIFSQQKPGALKSRMNHHTAIFFTFYV